MQETNENELIFTVSPFKYFVKYSLNSVTVDAMCIDDLSLWSACVIGTLSSHPEQSNSYHFNISNSGACDNLNGNVCDSQNINTSARYDLQLSPDIIFGLFKACKENTPSKKTTIIFPTNFVNHDSDINIEFNTKFLPYGKNFGTMHEDHKILTLRPGEINFEERTNRKLMHIKSSSGEQFEILNKLALHNNTKYGEQFETLNKLILCNDTKYGEQFETLNKLVLRNNTKYIEKFKKINDNLNNIICNVIDEKIQNMRVILKNEFYYNLEKSIDTINSTIDEKIKNIYTTLEKELDNKIANMDVAPQRVLLKPPRPAPIKNKVPLETKEENK